MTDTDLKLREQRFRAEHIAHVTDREIEQLVQIHGYSRVLEILAAFAYRLADDYAANGAEEDDDDRGYNAALRRLAFNLIGIAERFDY
jgi:hypothetical protein